MKSWNSKIKNSNLSSTERLSEVKQKTFFLVLKTLSFRFKKQKKKQKYIGHLEKFNSWFWSLGFLTAEEKRFISWIEDMLYHQAYVT